MKDLFIFTSAGSCDLSFEYKQKAYQTWDLDLYDNACVKHDVCDKFQHDNYFNFVIEKIGFKFPNFFWFIDNYKILDQYKYFGIIDDDLLFNRDRSFKNIVDLMEKYSLDLCSPSCDKKGKASWYNVMRTTDSLNELWISNFCEMGCMFVKKDLILKFKDLYYDSNYNYNKIIDYGFDHMLCNFANPEGFKCGIVKNITYYNPIRKYSLNRENGFDNWKQNVGKNNIIKKIHNIKVKEKITIEPTKRRKKRFLICITSHKRPLQLLGQIHRFNNQSFKDLDISVVVRGCDSFVYNIIRQEVSIYDNVFISQKENGDQLNNLMDCIRQTDESRYDYFCKIDDDDIYSLDYISNISTKIESSKDRDKIIGFCNTNPLIVIKEKEQKISIYKTIRGLFGNTLGFNLYVYKILDEISRDKDNIKKILDKHKISIENPRQYITSTTTEDKLIDHIMKSLNSEDSVYLDIALDKQLYYCKLSSSIVNIN